MEQKIASTEEDLSDVQLISHESYQKLVSPPVEFETFGQPVASI
jgi:hypothetical protein